MNKKTNKNIKEFISTISKLNSNFVKAFIFGSYAKNIQHRDSDIDIALIIKNLKDSEEFDLQVELLLIASKIDSRIEPHPISFKDFNSHDPFAVEIKKTGIEIKI